MFGGNQKGNPFSFGSNTSGLFGAAQPPNQQQQQPPPQNQPTHFTGFGQQPTSQPAAASSFGAFGTGGSGGFNNNNPFGQQQQPQQPMGTAPVAGAPFNTTSSQPSFGQASAAPSSIFGQQTSSQTQSTSLFTQSTAAAALSPFGQTVTSQAQPHPPLFGAQTLASNPFGATSQQKPASGFNKPAAQASGPVFGQVAPPPTNLVPSTGHFGPSAATTTQASASSGGLFGQATTAQAINFGASTTSLFGSAAPSAASAFGQMTFSATPPTTTPLFNTTSQPGIQPAQSTVSDSGQMKFGATPPTTTPSAPNVGLFGAATQPPVEKTMAAPAVSTFSFATQSSSATTAAAPIVPSFSFGDPGRTTAAAVSSSPALPSFGTNTSVNATAPAMTASQATQPAFTIPTSTPGPMKLSDLGTSATKPPAPALFPAPTSTGASSAPIATAVPPLPGATTSVISGATTIRSVGPSTSLKAKTVEQIVNDWKIQTMKYEQEFRKLAVEIGRWDVMLWKNGDELTKLTKEVDAAEETQRLIDQNLEYIESEQSQMDEALASYEGEIRKLFEGDGPERVRMTPADQEREKAYGLAATLNSQFDDMIRQLASMVEDINATLHPSTESEANNTTNGKSKDDGEMVQEQSTYSQVVRILNHHLSSLRWLDSQVSQLDRRVGEIDRYKNAAENVVSRLYHSGKEGGAVNKTISNLSHGVGSSTSGGTDWATLQGH